MIKIRYFLVCCIISSNIFAFDIEVDVLNESYIPTPIIISNFHTDDKTKDIYKTFKDVLDKDLVSSGAVDPIYIKDDIIEMYYQETVFGKLDLYKVDFDMSEYIFYKVGVIGQLVTQNSNLVLEILYINNFKNEVIKAEGYTIKGNQDSEIINVAHDVANTIYELVTGRNGFFNSYLLYADNNKLMMSNYLGENPIELVAKPSGSILSPKFSNDGSSIAYVHFLNGRSSIYIYDLYTKSSTQLVDINGLGLSPSFSRENDKVLFSLATNGATNIYEYNINNKQLKALTKSFSINLSGNYSSYADLIVFNSDRTGSPQIYTIDKARKRERISKGEGSYYNPVFAHDSNIILFTKILDGKFMIGLMDLQGNEKIIARDTYAESPYWLEDDRHIIYQYRYSKKAGKSLYSFYILDILSGEKIRVAPTEDAQNPSLSNGKVRVGALKYNKYNIKQN